jgi:hypothetical protein
VTSMARVLTSISIPPNTEIRDEASFDSRRKIDHVEKYCN